MSYACTKDRGKNSCIILQLFSVICFEIHFFSTILLQKIRSRMHNATKKFPFMRTSTPAGLPTKRQLGRTKKKKIKMIRLNRAWVSMLIYPSSTFGTVERSVNKPASCMNQQFNVCWNMMYIDGDNIYSTYTSGRKSFRQIYVFVIWQSPSQTYMTSLCWQLKHRQVTTESCT